MPDTLSYSGETLTRDRYAALLATDPDAIPDLVYDAQIIVATTDRLACRLLFVCTPRRPFLGFTPNGRQLTFAEPVFYDFRDGRITAVTSLIDRFAIQSQLSDT